MVLELSGPGRSPDCPGSESPSTCLANRRNYLTCISHPLLHTGNSSQYPDLRYPWHTGMQSPSDRPGSRCFRNLWNSRWGFAHSAQQVSSFSGIAVPQELQLTRMTNMNRTGPDSWRGSRHPSISSQHFEAVQHLLKRFEVVNDICLYKKQDPNKRLPNTKFIWILDILVNNIPIATTFEYPTFRKQLLMFSVKFWEGFNPVSGWTIRKQNNIVRNLNGVQNLHHSSAIC